MPRLTRTQKFADLREQLANDSERNLSTPQLDEYANRLNQMEDQAGYFNQSQEYNQNPQQPQYNQQYQESPFVQPVEPTYVAPQQPQYQQQTYVAPTPTVEPTPVYTEPKPVVQPVEPEPVVQPVQQPYVDPFTQRVQESPFVQPVEPTYVAPQQPQYQQQTYVAPTPTVEPTPVYTEPKPVVQPVEPEPVVQPVQQPYVDPFTQRVQESPFVQPVEQTYVAPQQPQYQQPTYVAPTPTVEPTPIYTEPEPVVQPVEPTYVAPEPIVESVPVFTTPEPFQHDLLFDTPIITPSFEEFMKTVEIPIPVVENQVDSTRQGNDTILNPYNNEQTIISNIAEIENQEPLFKGIDSQEAELLDELEVLHTEDTKQDAPIANDTFVEVNTYNQGVGNDTIDQITNDLVENIRHLEEAQESECEEVQDPIYEEVEISDEEFSNTVSMEISKVMEEVANATTQLDVKDILAPTEAEKTPDDFVKEYFNNGEDQLSKTLNDLPKVEEITPQQQLTSELQRLASDDTKEDIVEIKNIADLEGTHDVISDTIPFAINQDEEEDEYYDEEEDDASNTVLNVILIVLIIILVAVLGLIVFYILKTKGILG